MYNAWGVGGIMMVLLWGAVDKKEFEEKKRDLGN